MKKSILVLGVLCAFNANANTSREVIDFGKDLLQTRYQAFAEKMNRCDEQAKNTDVSDETLAQLQSIPPEAALSLAILNYRALQQCALYEYTEALRTLVSLENTEAFTPSAEETESLKRMRSLLVADMSLYIEKEYSDMSPKLKDKLENIAELKRPFNVNNTIKSAWPDSF